ncbi:MAG: hypothetical protein JSS83_29190 [Cyanobacteria bacterium SZAS LIN-3]|nr:hypothetical protein [Acidobacteriota bacterium]MBS1994637.1 hypothetical protein [Cyanobacteria bacterium SZAS LIN-3]
MGQGRVLADWTLLIFAGLLSAESSLVAAGIHLFFAGVKLLDRDAFLLSWPSLLLFPLFLTVFLSRKWHARVMWVLAIWSVFGSYLDVRAREPGQSVLMAGIHAVRYLPILQAIVIAVLTEIAYRIFLSQGTTAEDDMKRVQEPARE